MSLYITTVSHRKSESIVFKRPLITHKIQTINYKKQASEEYRFKIGIET